MLTSKLEKWMGFDARIEVLDGCVGGASTGLDNIAA